MDKKEKQKFGKEMSSEEIEMIKREREIKSKTVDNRNEYAFKIACLSDQDYLGCIKQISGVERMLFSLLNTKEKIRKNKIEIEKGETKQKFTSGPWSGEKKEIEDLVSENILNNDVLFEALENIRQGLNNLYFNHVNNIRLGDKKVYFSEEKYNKYVEKIINVLKEHKLDLFIERQDKVLQ